MKWAITLGSAKISGGTYVIFEHVTRNIKRGEEIYVITEEKVKKEDYSWHSEAKNIKFKTYDEIKDINFDIAIATWWVTVYNLYKIKARKYAYFVQSIESKFYKERIYQLMAEATYTLGLNIITEATWIKDYFKEKYDIDAFLVKNGIRKDIYNTLGEKYEKCDGLRVLVEGPVDVDFKNVPKTIKLIKESNADEVWLLTSSNITEYKGVDRVFSRVPINDCAKIYRSCDLIVKLSYVEGMFGPPLEMFHCGGTAIVYDVTGHDEYIINGKNGIVIKTDDDEKVVEAINRFKDKSILKKYKDNAIKTANEWINWEESSKQFRDSVYKILDLQSITQSNLKGKITFYNTLFDELKNNPSTVRGIIGKKIKNKTPGIYNFLKKILK